jgi:hypothetical protein
MGFRTVRNLNVIPSSSQNFHVVCICWLSGGPLFCPHGHPLRLALFFDAAHGCCSMYSIRPSQPDGHAGSGSRSRRGPRKPMEPALQGHSEGRWASRGTFRACRWALDPCLVLSLYVRDYGRLLCPKAPPPL